MKTIRTFAATIGATAAILALFTACAHRPPVEESEPAETGFTPIRSTQIFSANYFEADETLTVVLRSGEVFDYQKVPRALYEQFLAAEDKDAFYRDHLRGRFDERRVEF